MNRVCLFHAHCFYIFFLLSCCSLIFFFTFSLQGILCRSSGLDYLGDYHPDLGLAAGQVHIVDPAAIVSGQPRPRPVRREREREKKKTKKEKKKKKREGGGRGREREREQECDIERGVGVGGSVSD